MKKDVIIEIPKGSNIKYEIENGKVKVDRILFGSSSYPTNYGYFENTLDWDGDPLDVLVYSDHSFMPGVVVPVRILGEMLMIDGGETDTKIIAVIDVDPRYNDVKDLKDIGEHRLNELRDYFENYKNLQNKKVEINGFRGLDDAIKTLKETEELYKKYNKLSKKEFVNKMKKEHPNKYK